MDVILTLIFSIILFNYAHEFGHFIVARLTAMPIPAMYVGVGPALARKTTKSGTQMVFGLIPVASMQADGRVFREFPAFRRLLVASAGPMANFLFTFVLLAVSYIGFNAPSTAVVSAVDVDGRAYEAGMRDGDRLVAVDGSATETWSDAGLRLLDRVGDTGTLELAVQRGEERLEYGFEISRWQSDVAQVDVFGDLGIGPDTSSDARASLFGGLFGAVRDTVRMFWSTTVSGFKMLFGSMSVLNFGGAMQLTQLGLDAGSLDAGDYLKLFALFSLCFGLINLLPGPIVDGLAMIVAAVEWVAGRPLPSVVDKLMQIVGYVLAFGPIPLCIIHELIRVNS
ncbi:MAG: M50 family metallopeptidase [Gammaproteobacteria bacterium]|nr:M50 family metallopeptidase [Gammaproteobacteria bacterium]MCY4340416.1 M50 family metallopeptidase [Gammaproteobacteria bacterium]